MSSSVRSPEIMRGNIAFDSPTLLEDSTNVVLAPLLEAARAAESPAAPPPTTKTFTIGRRQTGVR